MPHFLSLFPPPEVRAFLALCLQPAAKTDDFSFSYASYPSRQNETAPSDGGTSRANLETLAQEYRNK